MDLENLKKEYIRTDVGISDDFGKILSFIDFGNVNHWFEEDRQDYDHKLLETGTKLSIDLNKLRNFTQIFSFDIRFYYGYDPQNTGSLGFILKSKEIYDKKRVFTKHIQRIKHYLNSEVDIQKNTRDIYNDNRGTFVYIPKCNFDVEISVDAVKLIENYDTICLFSSDADFVHLLRFLKGKGKKVILIKGGNIVHQLREIADLVINAQDIKKHVSLIRKQKPGS